MRLSDAWLRQRQTKTPYSNHQLPPWLTDDATRDRWLGFAIFTTTSAHLILGI
jgi:hypothetical protein